MRNGGYQETHLVGEVLAHLVALLPASWQATMEATHPESDGVLKLKGPAGAAVSFAVEVTRAGTASVPRLVELLRQRRGQTGLPVVLFSDYLGPATRRQLADAGLGYADATGWVRLVSEDPLVLLTGEGADRSPRAPDSSAVVRMNGVATNRVVRALSMAELPVGVRSLSVVAGVSPGSVSKLLATLAAEGIVDRDERGAAVAVRRRSLLRRWVQDYGYATTNGGLGYWLAPRGLVRVTELLAQQAGVVITGSAAARQLLPPDRTSVVPMRLLALYSASPTELARELGLVEADPATANVVIAVPQDLRILPGEAEGAALAPPALVLADLLTLPGRSDAEAEQLMDSFAMTDPSWKE